MREMKGGSIQNSPRTQVELSLRWDDSSKKPISRNKSI